VVLAERSSSNYSAAEQTAEAAVRVHSTLLEYEKPTKRQVKNLHKWFEANNPLVVEEDRYVWKPRDLFTLAVTKSPLFRCIESQRSFQKMFLAKVRTDTRY